MLALVFKFRFSSQLHLNSLSEKDQRTVVTDCSGAVCIVTFD